MFESLNNFKFGPSLLCNQAVSLDILFSSFEGFCEYFMHNVNNKHLLHTCLLSPYINVLSNDIVLFCFEYLPLVQNFQIVISHLAFNFLLICFRIWVSVWVCFRLKVLLDLREFLPMLSYLYILLNQFFSLGNLFYRQLIFLARFLKDLLAALFFIFRKTYFNFYWCTTWTGKDKIQLLLLKDSRIRSREVWRRLNYNYYWLVLDGSLD